MKRRLAILGAAACLLTAALASYLSFPNAAGARTSHAAANHALASAARADVARAASVASAARALLRVANQSAASSRASRLRAHAAGLQAGRHTAATNGTRLNRSAYIMTGTARSGFARVAYRGMRATYAGSGGAGTGTMAHGCLHTTSSTTPSGK